jgi:hypothetical protein
VNIIYSLVHSILLAGMEIVPFHPFEDPFPYPGIPIIGQRNLDFAGIPYCACMRTRRTCIKSSNGIMIEYRTTTRAAAGCRVHVVL